jgi:cell division protein FtsL
MANLPISKVDVGLSMDWGVKGIDYVYTSSYTKDRPRPCDLQDLLIDVSLHRAKRVEGEIEPLSTRIQNRNETLDDLGDALADLTKLQSMFDSEAEGGDREGTLSGTSYDTLVQVFGSVDFDNLTMTKYEVEEWLQKVKSKIDSLNNQSEKDMSRLESLVDRRDEAFSTASDLMSEISDTRGNTIGNMA